MGRELRIVLEGENPVSWNQFYSGKHWTHRKELADRVHMLVRSALPRDCPFFEKCTIKIVAYVTNGNRDADNICSKLYIDGMKGIVFKDDTIKYIPEVTTRGEVDKKRPRLEIIVTEVV